MVGGLKVVRVKAGLEQEFERLFGQLWEEMRAHEKWAVCSTRCYVRAKTLGTTSSRSNTPIRTHSTHTRGRPMGPCFSPRCAPSWRA